MREYFKSLPDQSTPLTGERLNGIFNGEESIEKLVVGDIECKNLFNINAVKGISTLTVNDQKLTVTAYANNTGQTLKELCPELEVGETYTLSFVSTARGGDSTHLTDVIYLNSSALKWENGTSHTISENDLSSNVYFYGSYGDYAGETTTISNIQLEKGSVATEYTPHKSLGYTSGSNENGSWVKYDDGRLEVEGTAQCPAGVGYADITFPMAFIDTNYIMVANHKYTGGSEYGGSAQLLNITNPQSYTTTQAYIYSYLPDGSFAGYPRNVQYIAKGRWK